MKNDYDLSIETLNVFCKVIEQNGFHAAAKYLDLSEPAVSFRIKKTEECMRTLLIERGRSIRLTENGKIFYEYAKKTVADYELIRKKLDNMEKGLDGELTIAAGTSVSKYLLPSVCSKLHAEHPEVKINILTCSSGEVCEKVLNETVDLGFTIQDVIFNRELSGQTIAVNQEVIVARSTHPLAHKEKIAPQELLNYGFVISADWDDYRSIKSAFLKKTKISIEKSNIVLEDFDMAKRYARESNTLLIGPMFSFSDEFQQNFLIPLDLEGESYYCKIRLVKRKDKVLTTLQKKFIKLAKKTFQARLT